MDNIYSFQDTTVSSIDYSLDSGNKNIMISSPTSSGKSFMIMKLVNTLQTSKHIVMVGISDLIEQLYDRAISLGVDVSVVKSGMDDLFNIDARTTIGMIQTIFARLDKKDIVGILRDVDYIIIDEGHKFYNTSTISSIMSVVGSKPIIRFTATPYDSEGYLFPDVDDYIIASEIKYLEEIGALVKARYYVPSFVNDIDLTQLKVLNNNDYSSVDISSIYNTDNIISLTISSMNELNAKCKKTIVFCSSIEHCDAMAEALVMDGYKAYSYHSKSDSKKSKEMLKLFKDGSSIKTSLLSDDEISCNCLVSMNKLSIGFDVSDIELVVPIRPSPVRSLIMQIIGRGARPHKGKKYFEVLDVSKILETHGYHNEPYMPVKRYSKDYKEKLSKEKERVALSIVKKITSESGLHEITRDKVSKAIAEVEKNIKMIPELSVDDLKYHFETSKDLYIVMEVVFEINKRQNQVRYNKSQITKIVDAWIEFINDFPIYESRIIKTFKTLAKKCVINNKKLYSLYYVAQEDSWLRSMSPYIISDKIEYKQETIDIDIDYDDIPF